MFINFVLYFSLKFTFKTLFQFKFILVIHLCVEPMLNLEREAPNAQKTENTMNFTYSTLLTDCVYS